MFISPLLRPLRRAIKPRAACQTAVAAIIILLCTAFLDATDSVRSQRPAKQSPSAFAEEKALLAKGDISAAKERIQEQLALHPSVEGYNLLGIAKSSERDLDGALEAFAHALQLNPNSSKTHNNLGNLYVAQGKPDLAEKEFRKVLVRVPGDRNANYNLGLLLLARGSPAAAIPHLQRIRPADVETRFNLIRACLQAGRSREALVTAATLSADRHEDVQLHFTLGVLLGSEKQYKAAQTELERANALTPEAFEILYNLGQVYFRGENYGKAELALNRALKIRPDSPDVLYQLARLYSEQSRPVDALEMLVRAHKLAPQNTDVIFLMARVSMTQNYYEDAIPLLEAGIKIAPERADLHAALGESYFMSGKAEKAIAEFKKLIELDPSSRSYAFMGLSSKNLGRFDEARKYFEEGLKKNPHDPTCLFNIGFIEERQGDGAAAEQMFQAALNINPNYAEALLELANLRMKDKKFTEAAVLLRRYVKVSSDPASGYYKLAMVERNLHQTAAAQRDLNVFQTLSKDSSTGPYPYQHLFDYLDNRAKFSRQERTELDIAELIQQINKNPGQPRNLYQLAESYLKLGRAEDASKTIAQLDQLSADDYRMQTGIGVLLARFHKYDAAIQHFENALRSNPDSDDVKFDLADAHFRKGAYAEALDAVQKISAAGQQDDSYLSLRADIYAHLGDNARAVEIFRDAISRNPDNDQYYLSLALTQLRSSDGARAEQTLNKGLARLPGSGKILWGLGLISVLQGNSAQAAERLERAVDLLPEWAGSYSTLGLLYYQTGQIERAREVLDRFKGSSAGGLNVHQIEEALSRAPQSASSPGEPLSMSARQQLLQLALSIADRTL